MVEPAAKREAVVHLRERFQMSERRACTVIAADRKMIRYRPRDRFIHAGCRPAIGYSLKITLLKSQKVRIKRVGRMLGRRAMTIWLGSPPPSIATQRTDRPS